MHDLFKKSLNRFRTVAVDALFLVLIEAMIVAMLWEFLMQI